MSSIEQNQFNAEKLTVPGSTSIARQADQQVLDNSKKLTNDTPINTRTVNVSKIIAIISGVLAATSMILAILGAFHVVTFLSLTAIAALVLSSTIAALYFGIIGSDEDDNIVFNTENNVQPSSMVDLMSFLEKGQNLVAKIGYFGTKLGEGGFGAVSEVTAQFVNKADEQIQNIRTKIVKKEYKNADGPSVINEVMINYILTQYIAKHREDPSLEKYFKSFPLLVLTPKQNEILSGVKSYEDLRERIENNIFKFSTVYLEKKPGISLDKHIRSSNSFSSFQDVKEVFKNTLIALSLLNRLGIAHRDIKPGNMMIDGQNIFLLDFGTSFIPQE